jgi:1-phosphatidylinositol phosphodiesterase
MQAALRTITLFGTIISSCLWPTQSMALDLNHELAHWMDHVSDAVSLTDLTIHGSPDSGSRYDAFAGTAKYQKLTIRDQLDPGVRYLYIRLRHYGDVFVVHHEVAMMAVSQEYTSENNRRTLEQTFSNYTDDPIYRNFWWRHSYMPQVGDARGEIALLRRFFDSFWTSGGVDITTWPDNTAFIRYDTRGVAINV